jgi:DNA-directed RNA polymerase subunit H (RpoH/RPB5)
MAVITLPEYDPWKGVGQALGVLAGKVALPYMLNKDLIKKYEDTNLSDIDKQKFKKYLPDAIKDDGTIDWNKIQEYAEKGQGASKEIASHLLEVRKNREDFKNTNIFQKTRLIQDPNLRSALAPSINLKAYEGIENLQKLLPSFEEKLPIIKKMREKLGDYETAKYLMNTVFGQNPVLGEYMLELLGGDKKTADTNQTQQQSSGGITLNENNLYPNHFSPLSYLPQQSIQPPEQPQQEQTQTTQTQSQPQQKTKQTSSKKKSNKRKTSMLNLPPLAEVVKQMQQKQKIKYLLTPEQLQQIYNNDPTSKSLLIGLFSKSLHNNSTPDFTNISQRLKKE